jgi:hypothetical protein
MNCDEYPCYASLAGVGPEDLQLVGSLAAPFDGEKTAAITMSAPADGGMAWTASIAIVPQQEPQARVDSITSRLYNRITRQGRP